MKIYFLLSKSISLLSQICKFYQQRLLLLFTNQIILDQTFLRYNIPKDIRVMNETDIIIKVTLIKMWY